MEKEKINISDKHGFIYEITLEHQPQHGFTTGFYDGRIVGQVQLGRLHPPTSDDDREWEAYQERLSEWTDEIKFNMNSVAKQYFDANMHKKKV